MCVIKEIAISNLLSNSTLSLLHRQPMFPKCSTLGIPARSTFLYSPRYLQLIIFRGS